MTRPQPPASLAVPNASVIKIESAQEVWDWLKAEILAEDGSIHNPDHVHLLDAGSA